MNDNYVWGIFVNDGDGDQLLFYFGVFTTEEKAISYYDEVFANKSRDIWIDKIELK